MSEFLKLAYELIAKIIYNIAQVFVAIIKLFFTGWPEYIVIFNTYFYEMNVVGKIFALLLALILVAIPVVIIYLLVKRTVLYIKLRADREDNATLYREIGRLNRQVLELVDEKNKLLALKVNAIGAGRLPYAGDSALVEGAIPSVGNVLNGQITSAQGGGELGDNPERNLGKVTVMKDPNEDPNKTQAVRFPKLALVDQKYLNYVISELKPALTDIISQGISSGEIHFDHPAALAEIVLIILTVKMDNSLAPTTPEETEDTIQGLISLLEKGTDNPAGSLNFLTSF